PPLRPVSPYYSNTSSDLILFVPPAPLPICYLNSVSREIVQTAMINPGKFHGLVKRRSPLSALPVRYGLSRHGQHIRDLLLAEAIDRQSTRLNSNHVSFSYSVFFFIIKNHYY